MQMILIVDDDVSFGMLINGFLERNGFKTELAASVEAASKALKSKSFDLVLTDFRLPDGNGIDVLTLSKERSKSTQVILITAYSEIKTAVRAIKEGAYDYITKPVNPQELLHLIHKALQTPTNLPSGTTNNKSGYIVPTSSENKRIEEHINLVAPTDIAVLIQGESGTGKEIVARRIHELSVRKNEPFIAVDCGALTQELASSELFGHIKGSFTGALNDKTGHFEAVGNGTIFLDEIGNLNYEVQIKLLRALQEKKGRKIGSNHEFPIKARIIAATNEDLRSDALKGHFREDLFHRLNEFTIHTLPLRQRRGDMVVFMEHFMQVAAQEFNKEVRGFSLDVIDCFKRYEWPGNIREIKNVVRRSVLLSQGSTIEIDTIPDEIRYYNTDQDELASPLLEEAKSQSERATIIEALKKTLYNKTKTSELLGIDRKTLYNKLQKYKINY